MRRIHSALRLPILALLAASAAAAGPPSGHLGLQLWSLHAQFKQDVTSTLATVRSFGFTTVETAGTYGLTAGEFRSRLDAHGLVPVSAHFSYEQLAKDLPGSIAQARALGVEYIVVPWIPHQPGHFGADEARAAAATFNAWGAAVRAGGMKFAYHTHGYEFAGGGSETAFDVLVRSTRPDLVFFEMDVYWVAHAGVDPTRLLEEYAGRWRMLHLKDLRIGAPTNDTGAAPPGDIVAVGKGQIAWPAVLDAARKAGVVYYFIEDESVAPLLGIPESLRYLGQFGL